MASKTFFLFAFLGIFRAVSAFWRMECHGRAGVARIDPIMDAGVISPHVHVVHGSSGKRSRFRVTACFLFHKYSP